MENQIPKYEIHKCCKLGRQPLIENSAIHYQFETEEEEEEFSSVHNPQQFFPTAGPGIKLAYLPLFGLHMYHVLCLIFQ